MSLRLYGYLAALLSLAGALFWAYSSGKAEWHGQYDAEVRAHQATREEHARTLAHLADLTEAARQEDKRKQEQYVQATAANDKSHKQEMANALGKKDSVIAELRLGVLQLQPWWEAGNRTCPAEGGVASTAGGQVDAGDLRAEGAAALVQILAEADADRGWYIRELTATRDRCSAGGGQP